MDTDGSLLLRCGRVFDPRRGRLDGPLDVLVRDGVIVSVERSIAAGEARLVELPDCTLLPGMVDLDVDLLPDPVAGDTGLWLYEALGRAGELLRSGFTTARVLGGSDPRWSLLDLRRALAEGLAPGPGLLVAAHLIDDRVAAQDLARAVQREGRNDVDWIAVDRREPREGDLRAVVDAADGVPVAVAATTIAELQTGVAAGARSIEVSCALDKPTARLVAASGAHVVPRDGFATTADVPVAFGGRLTGGVVALAELGLSATAAITAATRGAADCAGLTAAGRVGAGAAADLIAVADDPLAAIERLADVALVVHRGQIQP